jgi:hypothetical protein
MTNEEAIKDIKEYIKPIVGGESLSMAIDALERQSNIDEAIKILQTIDWVGSEAKGRIQDAIGLLI